VPSEHTIGEACPPPVSPDTHHPLNAIKSSQATPCTTHNPMLTFICLPTARILRRSEEYESGISPKAEQVTRYKVMPCRRRCPTPVSASSAARPSHYEGTTTRAVAACIPLTVSHEPAESSDQCFRSLKFTPSAKPSERFSLALHSLAAIYPRGRLPHALKNVPQPTGDRCGSRDLI